MTQHQVTGPQAEPVETPVLLLDPELPEGFRVEVQTGKDHNDAEEAGGVTFQRCGGGRRIIRKQLS